MSHTLKDTRLDYMKGIDELLIQRLLQPQKKKLDMFPKFRGALGRFWEMFGGIFGRYLGMILGRI